MPLIYRLPGRRAEEKARFHIQGGFPPAVVDALRVLNDGTAEAVVRRVSLARVDWT